ncbi:alpha/beta fold hydrolase [Synechococcus sp. M16CYN]|uniref:alpha/beta fold hydrolase n=1 Tax=Synechococcus sp. M16CYN TaxID=3103139 RepID=UPI003252FEF3
MRFNTAKPLKSQAGTSSWGEHFQWIWYPRQGGQHWCCHWRVLGPGHGPALVLLHGFGAASGHWRYIAPKLAAYGWRVFSFDLLGFGDSDQPGLSQGGHLDNSVWGQQTSAFLQEIVQRPAVLVGNSLGGLTALTAAVLRPDQVRAVIAAPLPDPALIQSFPTRRSPQVRRLQRNLLSLLIKLLPLQLIVLFVAQNRLIRLGLQGAYTHCIANDFELQQLISRPVRRATAARALRAMSLGMSLRPRGVTAPALLDRLNNRVPLMLIWGRDDRFVPLAIGQKVIHQHSWIELAVIDACGHCPHDETPDLFLDVLLSWLGRNLTGSEPTGEAQKT